MRHVGTPVSTLPPDTVISNKRHGWHVVPSDLGHRNFLHSNGVSTSTLVERRFPRGEGTRVRLDRRFGDLHLAGVDVTVLRGVSNDVLYPSLGKESMTGSKESQTKQLWQKGSLTQLFILRERDDSTRETSQDPLRPVIPSQRTRRKVTPPQRKQDKLNCRRLDKFRVDSDVRMSRLVLQDRKETFHISVLRDPSLGWERAYSTNWKVLG